MIESEVIREVNHPAWPLVWQIYGESFPRYEQRQSQHQPQKMRDPRYHCQIFYQDGLLLGFIFWWACGEQIYIEHLAINPALRGRKPPAGRILRAGRQNRHSRDRSARG